MAITVIVHIANSDPIVGEIDELPDPSSQFITCVNPRARDGKSIVYIDAQATRVMFPWSRISFLETLPSEEDQVELESFFRD
jgi:hypothetical protein